MGALRVYRLLLIVAAVTCTAAALIAYGFDVFKGTELASVDSRFAIRGDQGPPQNLVFVKIDDSTFSHYGSTVYPFRRRLHAEVIRNLERAGAKVIAYDVQFTEPSDHPADDNALIEAVRAGDGRVVLATTEVGRGGSTRIFGGGAGLAYSRAVPGNSNVPNDPGGVFRRVAYEIGGLTSFPVAAGQVALGHRVPPPPEGGKTAWIDFPGPPGTVRSIPFWRVQRGQFPPDLVRGKIVVVGASAPSLQDLHPTSTTGSDPMPGPEIQAAAIDTVIRGYPLHSGPGWVNVLLILALGLAAPLATLRLSTPASIAVGIASVAVFLVGAQIAFDNGTIVNVVYPVLAAVLSLVAVLILRAITAAFEREQVREVFARFVPEAVVGQALERADGARLGGVRQQATVLFSDLRGFTSFSERREPDEVIEILNRYLTEMSDAILDHGGTLVAYMGDGIMACFGAPIEEPDHADRALAAGRKMLARMDEFNERMAAEGDGGRFKMGIGLNSGWVMSGNVGSDRRLEYTVIGDVTNTAARLEGMTKGTPYQLYLSDSTRRLLSQEPPDLESVGEFEVRGREARIVLWTLTETAFAEAPGAEGNGAPAAMPPDPELTTPAPAEPVPPEPPAEPAPAP
jgi:adenylate cyclase